MNFIAMQHPGTAETMPATALLAESEGQAQRAKFSDPYITAKGEPRASVPFTGYRTLWFNTGTLCNLSCHNCYIESSPKNDRLVYLTRNEVKQFLDEASQLADSPAEIGFTGGEPFMNPDIIGMLEDCLACGFRALVLTNAMKPMQRLLLSLLELKKRFPGRLCIRVSLDHYRAEEHESLRGSGTWQSTVEGLALLLSRGFEIAIAGRTVWGETDASMGAGYAALFSTLGLSIDATNPSHLVLFRELEPQADVPEISESCWSRLGKSPRDVMCASSRMVVKRSRRTVRLNHSHCARFCVLGGASCSVHR